MLYRLLISRWHQAVLLLGLALLFAVMLLGSVQSSTSSIAEGPTPTPTSSTGGWDDPVGG